MNVKVTKTKKEEYRIILSLPLLFWLLINLISLQKSSVNASSSLNSANDDTTNQQLKEEVFGELRVESTSLLPLFRGNEKEQQHLTTSEQFLLNDDNNKTTRTAKTMIRSTPYSTNNTMIINRTTTTEARKLRTVLSSTDNDNGRTRPNVDVEPLMTGKGIIMSVFSLPSRLTSQYRHLKAISCPYSKKSPCWGIVVCRNGETLCATKSTIEGSDTCGPCYTSAQEVHDWDNNDRTTGTGTIQGSLFVVQAVPSVSRSPSASPVALQDKSSDKADQPILMADTKTENDSVTLVVANTTRPPRNYGNEMENNPVVTIIVENVSVPDVETPPHVSFELINTTNSKNLHHTNIDISKEP